MENSYEIPNLENQKNDIARIFSIQKLQEGFPTATNLKDNFYNGKLSFFNRGISKNIFTSSNVTTSSSRKK